MNFVENESKGGGAFLHTLFLRSKILKERSNYFCATFFFFESALKLKRNVRILNKFKISEKV